MMRDCVNVETGSSQKKHLEPTHKGRCSTRKGSNAMYESSKNTICGAHLGWRP
jgi:hypothetical protein